MCNLHWDPEGRSCRKHGLDCSVRCGKRVSRLNSKVLLDDSVGNQDSVDNDGENDPPLRAI